MQRYSDAMHVNVGVGDDDDSGTGADGCKYGWLCGRNQYGPEQTRRHAAQAHGCGANSRVGLARASVSSTVLNKPIAGTLTSCKT